MVEVENGCEAAVMTVGQGKELYVCANCIVKVMVSLYVKLKQAC